MGGKPQKGGHHGITMRGWTPWSNHERVDTMGGWKPRESGHHRVTTEGWTPWDGGNHRVTMGGWKPRRHQTVATELNRNRRKL